MPYSDLCREKILSEDYHDFIVSDIRMPFLQDMLEKDYCLQNPGFFYQCAYLPKSVIKPVSLENYSYFSILSTISRVKSVVEREVPFGIKRARS